MSSIALGFKDFSVLVKNPAKSILNNVNGYVEKGCITAVMGASASGKSALLQALSGRIQDLTITGDCFMDGKKVNPKRLDNPIAYVPQEDSVIGELTAREVTMHTAVLKRKETTEILENEVQNMLELLGLSKVADGIIGTLIFRGLSGGQKKRVEISAELIASPSILLLDEPTSGLDSSISLEVISKIRELAKASQGRLSVILSIHQPNSSLLQLFDHLLLLDRGSTLFFGTVEQSIAYFDRIGFPCPASVTPTDFFLKITDSNFNFSEEFDFKREYLQSIEAETINNALEDHKKNCVQDSIKTVERIAKAHRVSFLKQVYVLIYREYSLAYRDPTLYYFQVALLTAFSFCTGAIFLKLPRNVDANFNIIPGSILWLTLMFSWVNVFKVYHISRTDKRTVHEVSNNKYPVSAFLVADFVSTATLTVLFFPMVLIAYFMMGFPAVAIPFVILCCWMTSLASEAMLSFIVKFSHNATTSMILSQIVLVVIMVFGGGVFIAWKDCPDYWVWIQETSIVTQSSRAMIMEVLKHLEFRCLLTDGVCISPGSGNHYRCSSLDSDGFHCQVNGREILAVTQGVGTGDDYWYYFAYLCAIFLFYKSGVVLLTIYPWDRVSFAIKSVFNKHTAEEITAAAERFARSLSITADAHDNKKNLQTVDPVRPYEAVEEGVAAITAGAGSSAALTWTDLSVTLPRSGAKLVDGISGMVCSGRVLALMGPSGAGKTTLLNGLSGRAKYAKVSGSIVFAGRTMNSADLTFVPQFDELNSILTVEDHIHLVGHLTCVDKVEMQKRAADLMEVLGLAEKRRTQLKNLSGGEIKRVSVGIGMISNPNVLFLDEPTTGLDSTAAFSIVNYISVLAKATNVAVIMTIHQPSALVFNMLDDLLLMETGRIVYSGRLSDAMSYFASVGFTNPKNINPADYYLELAQQSPTCGDAVTWKELFLKSPQFSAYQEELAAAISSAVAKSSPSTPSATVRFGYMFQHFMYYFSKERGLYFNRLLALILLGVFLGTLFLDLSATTDSIGNYVGAMFMASVCVMLTAISATAIFAKDRREAVDKVANGLFTPAVFVTTQFLASAIYSFAVSFVFSCIFHWLTNINPNHECFVYDFLLSWVYLMLMESVLLLAIEVMKNDFLCTTFGLVFLGCCMCFSGFFRKVPDSPPWINWMCFIFPLRWAFDGFLFQIFHSQDFTVSGVTPTTLVHGDDILNLSFDLKETPSWGLWAAVFGYVLLFRCGQYLLFAYQTGKLQLPFIGKNNQ